MVVFDPLDPETLQDPEQDLARLRADSPVQLIDNLKPWFVVRHDLVSEALRWPEVFFSKFPKSVRPLSEDDQRAPPEAMADGLALPATRITADGQVHTRYPVDLDQTAGRRNGGAG